MNLIFIILFSAVGQKHRHCGAIMTGTKNVTSETNAITLQFHTDQNDNRTQNFQYFTRNLKGFWLYFRGKSHNSLSCIVLYNITYRTR